MNYIIWDFDGTLAFREGMWSGALLQAVKHNLPDSNFVEEDFSAYLHEGFPWHVPDASHQEISSPDEWWEKLHPVFINALKKGAGIDIELAKKISIDTRYEYLDRQRWQVFEDVVPCLEKLRASGWRQVILSNHVPELEALVRELELLEYFDRVYTSALIGFEKPHPAAFDIVLNDLPASSKKVMIGDNYYADVEGATNAGIDAILVRKSNALAKVFHQSLDTLEAYIRGF